VVLFINLRDIKLEYQEMWNVYIFLDIYNESLAQNGFRVK
jgi:hypothetical protein